MDILNWHMWLEFFFLLRHIDTPLFSFFIPSEKQNGRFFTWLRSIAPRLLKSRVDEGHCCMSICFKHVKPKQACWPIFFGWIRSVAPWHFKSQTGGHHCIWNPSTIHVMHVDLRNTCRPFLLKRTEFFRFSFQLNISRNQWPDDAPRRGTKSVLAWISRF